MTSKSVDEAAVQAEHRSAASILRRHRCSHQAGIVFRQISKFAFLTKLSKLYKKYDCQTLKSILVMTGTAASLCRLQDGDRQQRRVPSP